MKTSKFFKTRNITAHLRDLEIGESLILELQPDISFNKAMATITATASQNGIRVSQKAFRTVSTDESDPKIHRFVRIKKESQNA